MFPCCMAGRVADAGGHLQRPEQEALGIPEDQQPETAAPLSVSSASLLCRAASHARSLAWSKTVATEGFLGLGTNLRVPTGYLKRRYGRLRQVTQDYATTPFAELGHGSAGELA